MLLAVMGPVSPENVDKCPVGFQPNLKTSGSGSWVLVRFK